MKTTNRLAEGGPSPAKNRAGRLRRLGPGDRVLVIRPCALGDTILSLPSLQAVRRVVEGEGRIELVGYPTPLRVAVSPLHADSIHSIDRARFAGLLSGGPAVELQGFLEPFDIVIAWCSDRLGHLKGQLELSGVPYLQSRAFPDEGSGVHAADHLMRTLEPLGVVGRTPTPELDLPEDSRAWARKILSSESLVPGRFLVIHPGSGSSKKNWSTEKYARLVHLATNHGLRVLLLEGQADYEPVRRLLERVEVKLPVMSNLNLMAVAALISEARMYVGNDSGITHLAAAVGASTWALFGPTDPKLWAPRGRRVLVSSFEIEPDELWATIQKVSTNVGDCP